MKRACFAPWTALISIIPTVRPYTKFIHFEQPKYLMQPINSNFKKQYHTITKKKLQERATTNNCIRTLHELCIRLFLTSLEIQYPQPPTPPPFEAIYPTENCDYFGYYNLRARARSGSTGINGTDIRKTVRIVFINPHSCNTFFCQL